MAFHVPVSQTRKRSDIPARRLGKINLTSLAPGDFQDS
jgi:hypothetical protein